MNTIILILLLLLTLLCVIHANGYDIFCPGALYCAVFILSGATLFVLGQGLDIHINTVITIWLGAIAFSAGDVFAAILAKKDVKHRRDIAISAVGDRIDIRVILLIMLIMIGGSIFTYIDIRRNANVGMSVSGTVIGAFKEQGANKSTVSSLINGLTSALAYAMLALVCYEYIEKNKIAWQYIAIVLLYLPIVIVTGSRIQVLYLVAIGISELSIIYARRYGWSYKTCIKILKSVGMVLIITLAIFFLLGMLTGKSNSFRFTDIVLVYLGAPTYGLDQYLNVYFNVIEGNGVLAFRNISGLLKALGIPVGSATFGYAIGRSAYGYYAILPLKGLYGNVYTGLFNWIHDVGTFGMIMVGFNISLLFSMLRRRVISQPTKCISALTVLSIYYVPIFFMSIDDLFDDDLTYQRILVAAFAYVFLRAYEKGYFSRRNSAIDVRSRSVRRPRIRKAPTYTINRRIDSQGRYDAAAGERVPVGFGDEKID